MVQAELLIHSLNGRIRCTNNSFLKFRRCWLVSSLSAWGGKFAAALKTLLRVAGYCSTKNGNNS